MKLTLRTFRVSPRFDTDQSTRAQSNSTVNASLPQCTLRCVAPTRRLPKLCATSLPSGINLDDLDLELEMPEIDGDLASYQAQAGAIFSEDGVVDSFGNEEEALEALSTGMVVVDRSHWGRLRVVGDDRLALLNNLTTQQVTQLTPGTGCETVFVTAQGRCIDLATMYVQASAVLLVVSPQMKDTLLEHMNKHILFGDKVSVVDVSDKCLLLSIMGPDCDALMKEMGAGQLVGGAAHASILLNFKGTPVIAAVGSGLASPGYTFVVDERSAGELWVVLGTKGAVPMGESAWELARVLQGRPKAGQELTEEFTPLEAGLYGAVSLSKGCYMGQETLAKVHNLDAVKQQLWGLELSAPARPGDTVNEGSDKVGRVTSVGETPEGSMRALAYIRSRRKGAQVDLEGKQVTVNGHEGRVVAVPYVSRSFAAANDEQTSEPKAAPSAAAPQQPTSNSVNGEGEGDSEEEARQAKLKAMQERLAAWQAAQKH